MDMKKASPSGWNVEPIKTSLRRQKAFLAEGLHPEIVARCTTLPLDVVMKLVENPADL